MSTEPVVNTIPTPARVLIARLSHLGDCVLTLPLLNALRAHLPRAEIGWSVEPLAAELLRGHPALDKLFVVPRGWMKSPAAVWRARRELRAWRPDVVLDPQSLAKSALLGWLSGAPTRVGFGGRWGRECAPWFNSRLVRPTRRHLVDRTLELLGPLGVERPAVDFALPENPAAADRVAAYLREAHLTGGFAVMHLGAGWRTKQWPAERFAAVAARLGDELETPSVLVWGGDDDQRLAALAERKAGGQALTAPRFSLPELAALLRRARLYVGADSGPLHLAAAVGAPCVGLYGPTRPEDCGPYGPGHIPVQAFHQVGRGRDKRHGENWAMQAIRVETVVTACARLLPGGAGGARAA